MIKSHIVQAHLRWQSWILPGDRIVDATVGNGHDTLFLAQLLQGKGELIGYDIQSEAIQQTQKRVDGLPDLWKKIVRLKHQSHEQFSESNVKLFVYNLGYLPGGNKAVTTQTESTLQSLKNALNLLSNQGAISITCYPGHPEGAREQEAILEFLKTLPSKKWEICQHLFINRPHSPTWIWLQLLPDANSANQENFLFFSEQR